uniref:Bm13246 n=1 Tax=Brugia malayi TaxID=6279 RepID=A0A0J9XP75_BRUMA|nr:Bm13246 [Brugia malayi]
MTITRTLCSQIIRQKSSVLASSGPCDAMNILRPLMIK